MADIKFEIMRDLGVLSEGSKGWRKEINLISWNGRQPKVDIRDWAPEREKMGKGVTLNRSELEALKEILNIIDIEELEIN
ncbi:MAG TPA: PC4/YdbC family ssDNA-binding protein [Syntrophomonadaceae bacterium]|nr:PC4/YdbC family ssDNA-binding protein [Syntrophomonadaceae bacterium]